ncbi:hypothetical protein [Neopusillimonas maritima]|jgi:hypothetical protein|uniref:Uncharacterized protein n=1 Tax=Neopusillimonas maritima TaxID=2026239 RepID=A0ABX9MU14_9BURK|nr:hypothetical protein [Neopusillimonas maritima]RII82073.1 hypothetical protein CJO09_13850 [Neopusillimonas maritima]
MKYINRSLKWHFYIWMAGMLMPLQAGWARPPSNWLDSSSARTEVERFIAHVGLADARWSSVESIRVQGVLFHFSRVTVRARLASVLDAFTEKDSPFEQILFGANQVLLSGWRQERHWLLHLNAAEREVQGTLSVLPFKPEAHNMPINPDHAAILNDWARAYSSLGQAPSQELP